MSCGVAAGTIRSTIEQGNVTQPSIHRASAADRRPANSMTAALSRAPLDGTLSQLISVKPAPPDVPPPLERDCEEVR